MNALIEKVRNEPVLVVTFVAAVLTSLVQFGIPLTDEQANSITVLVIAGLAFVARNKVVPKRNVE